MALILEVEGNSEDGGAIYCGVLAVEMRMPA